MTYTDFKSVEVFKTNVAEEKEADKVLTILSNKFPHYDVHFDLEDCDRILRIEGRAVSQAEIIALLSKFGYECTALIE